MLANLLFYLPMASAFISPSIFTPVFLTGLADSDLSYLPSNLGITLHFVFAAAALLGAPARRCAWLTGNANRRIAARVSLSVD
jgi:hypothetical protein